jgi:restriction system protein
MSRKTSGPQFVRFFGPLIQALQEMGGSASSNDATDKTAEIVGITDAERAALSPGGVPLIYNQIAWARLYLIKAGFMESPRRGIWALTKRGMSLGRLSYEEATAICRDVQRMHRNERSDTKSGETIDDNSPASPNDVLSGEPTNYRLHVLKIMQQLPSAGFERLCQRILVESGLDKVNVTGRSGDGGIDGEGVLQVDKFSLVSFKILFQCKRYQGSVGPDKVRDFRGAMAGRTEKGIFITTGSFTAEARKEAVRDGASQIELVDGEKLVDLLESIPLGLIPVATFEVDADFFQPFQIK